MQWIVKNAEADSYHFAPLSVRNDKFKKGRKPKPSWNFFVCFVVNSLKASPQRTPRTQRMPPRTLRSQSRERNQRKKKLQENVVNNAVWADQNKTDRLFAVHVLFDLLSLAHGGRYWITKSACELRVDRRCALEWLSSWPPPPRCAILNFFTLRRKSCPPLQSLPFSFCKSFTFLWNVQCTWRPSWSRHYFLSILIQTVDEVKAR